MKVDVYKVTEADKGWNVSLNVTLSPEELLTINQDVIDDIEDFNIYRDGSNLYFNCFLDKSEPWEDESLEELLKAIKIEVEYHVQSHFK